MNDTLKLLVKTPTAWDVSLMWSLVSLNALIYKPSRVPSIGDGTSLNINSFQNERPSIYYLQYPIYLRAVGNDSEKKRPYTIIHLVVIIYLCILLISQKLYSEWFTIFKWFSMCVLVFIRFFSLLLLSCGMCVYVFEWFFFHLFTFILCFLPSSMIKCMLNTFRLSITLLLLYSSVWI